MISGTKAAIDARNLRVRLGERVVLDDVSIAVPAGCLCALVGPNGAGKSTLLRTLAGILAPETGEIRHHLGDIAYVPQDRVVHWDLSVARVVALGRLPFGARDSGANTTAVDREMARMDVEHLAGRPVRELSGGERARVLFARALAQETPVLLADEPVAGLDPAHQLQLFDQLRGFAGEGRAILVVLHDLSLAMRYADSVVLLENGRIAASGAPRDVLSPANLARVFGVDMRVTEVEGVPVLVAMGSVTRAKR